jgi:acyl-CoA thioester hydrolase
VPERNSILREVEKRGLIEPRARIGVHGAAGELLQRSDVRVSEYDQLECRLGCRDFGRGVEQSLSAVAGRVIATRVRAVVRQRRRKVRMQPAKGANRHWVSEYPSKKAIPLVFAGSQTVAMLDVRVPATDLISPRPEAIVDADILAKYFTAPAVVIPGDHDDLYAGINNVREGCQRSETASGNHCSPFEPEFEQVAIDHERSTMRRDMSQKRDDRALDVRGCKAEVRVGEDVAGRVEHARILPVLRALYKRRWPDELGRVTNSSSRDSAAPTHHDLEFRVRYAETDQMGVVYHTNYLIWCEVGRTDFIRARGMSYADMERAGIGLAVSELSARFHAAARYDDMIRVRTTLAEVRSRGIIFDYLITRSTNGDRLVSARTSLVSIDASGRPIALPSTVRALFDHR